MPSRLADHLSMARRRRFVGREPERAAFQAALAATEFPFYLLYVFGPGGVGKTTLLQEFTALCDQQNIKTLNLDARHIDPSPDTFIQALQQALFDGAALSPLEVLAASNQRCVIMIDTYEKLTPLDGWLRDTFLPQLPGNVLMVMAGREPLSAGWRADPGWSAVIRSLPLRNLSAQESRSYLEQRNVPAAQHQAVLNFTHGHPLALSLVADAIDQRKEAHFLPEAAPDVIKTLLERLVQKLPSPAHRTALEACALLQATTEPLLAEMLAVADAHELFDWLRSLSFIEHGPTGLFPHDLVRDALCVDLRWRNPDWYRELHQRARRYFVRRMQETHGEEQRRILFGYIYLHRNNPVVRPVYDWQESGNVWTDAPRSADFPALQTMIKQHESEAAARAAKFWFDHPQASVQVFRSGEPAPAGFLLLLTLDRVSDDMLKNDVALDNAATYLQRNSPLRPGEKLSFLRAWMAGETYQALSPVQSRIFINVVQSYFYTPGLAFTFLAFAHPEIWEKVMAYADFARLPEADFEIGGQRFGIYGHDWRMTPLMRWLDLMGDREISQAEDYPAAPKTSATVVLSDSDFASAVHAALRAFTRPEVLRNNPLLNSRLVLEQCGASADMNKRVNTLLSLIQNAAASLQASPRDERFYRVLHRTYFNPAESQELAADTLHLSFSTYRRYLKAATLRITEILWDKEIST